MKTIIRHNFDYYYMVLSNGTIVDAHQIMAFVHSVPHDEWYILLDNGSKIYDVTAEDAEEYKKLLETMSTNNSDDVDDAL